MEILKLLIPLLSSFGLKLFDNAATRKALTKCDNDLSECQKTRQREVRIAICAVVVVAAFLLVGARYYTIASRA